MTAQFQQSDPPELRDREPAHAYVDGTLTDQHYRAARHVAGRPYVMVHRGDRARVVVGEGAVFGPDVVCLTGGNHRADWVTTFALREVYDLPGAYVDNPTSRGDIVIGPRARIGRGSWIVSGVEVGAEAVIRPYSMVTRDVPPGAVVAGSPARVVGEGFERPTVGAVPLPPGRPLRERLRGLAGRLHPPSVTWNDFPPTPSTYAAEVLDLGFASYDAPIIHGPPGGGHRVTFGPYCSVAFDAEVLVDPSVEPTDLDPAPPALAVEVGADVWCTRRVKLIGGARVGHGAILASGAVVRGDVRPYAIVAGNPAREVGRRFTDEQVEGLLAIAWWEWPDAVVRERYRDLCSPDTDGFLAKYGGSRG